MKIVNNTAIVVALCLNVSVSFAGGPTVEDILSASKIENLAAKGTQEDNLINAVRNGNTKDVETFIEGVDLEARDKQGMTALMIAAAMGYADIARTLISEGANVNAELSRFNLTVLFYAVDKGHTDIVNLLVDNDVTATADLFKGLFVSAVFKRNTNMVKALMRMDANINCDLLRQAYSVVNFRNTELLNILTERLASQCDSAEVD